MASPLRATRATGHDELLVASPHGQLLLKAKDDRLTEVTLTVPRPNGDAASAAAARTTAVPSAGSTPGAGGVLAEAARQLAAYFSGERREFDLPLCLVGTPFELRVWAALGEIGYGETVSYGELARRVGRPAAARAVGRAVGCNPIAIIVPCHRVVGASGKLTGYAGGPAMKARLLADEAVVMPPAGPGSQDHREPRRSA